MGNKTVTTFSDTTADEKRLLVGLPGKEGVRLVRLQISDADGNEAWAMLTPKQCKTLITRLCTLHSVLKG